jgi:hypothetical protein
MNVIKDIVMPIVKIANKSNVEKVEYDEREDGVKIWIYADIDEDIKRQLSDFQYSLIRKYGIGIEIVIVPMLSSTNLKNSSNK